MSSVYSKRLGSFTGSLDAVISPTRLAGLVPANRIWVLRDVSAFISNPAGAGPAEGFELSWGLPATTSTLMFRWIPLPFDSAGFLWWQNNFQWDGRLVLREGEELVITATAPFQNNLFGVTVTGYELTLP